MRTKGIMCYATAEDRRRLAAICKVDGGSGSNWLLKKLRERYAELYGDLDPTLTEKAEAS